MAAATIASARERTWSSAPVAAMRSQSCFGAGGVQSAQVCRPDRGVLGRGEDQRQGDRAVEQVGAAGLAGALGRAGDVEHVVEELKGEADLGAESAQRLAVASHPAGALEQLRGLEAAAFEVALFGDLRVEGVLALGKLAASQRRRGFRQQRDRTAVAVFGEEGKGAREEQVTGGDCAIATRDGCDRRLPAAQRRGVEDVVVDEGRHVDQLDRGRRPHRLLSTARAGAEQDQQRPQSLAAGGQRGGKVGARAARRDRGSVLAADPRPHPAAPAASGWRRRAPR